TFLAAVAYGVFDLRWMACDNDKPTVRRYCGQRFLSKAEKFPPVAGSGDRGSVEKGGMGVTLEIKANTTLLPLKKARQAGAVRAATAVDTSQSCEGFIYYRFIQTAQGERGLKTEAL